MILILRTILIYKQRSPAPEWKSDEGHQCAQRRSGKAKWKSEVCLRHSELSTGYPQVSCGYPAPHPIIVAHIFALVKKNLQKNNPTYVGFLIRTKVRLIFLLFPHWLFRVNLGNLC